MFDRRKFLQLAGGALTASALRAAPTKKPNFLLILADDMVFSDAGCYGGDIDTPNLDRLAARGLRLTQGYSTARCGPSRSSLLTGYYASTPVLDRLAGESVSFSGKEEASIPRRGLQPHQHTQLRCSGPRARFLDLRCGHSHHQPHPCSRDAIGATVTILRLGGADPLVRGRRPRRPVGCTRYFD